MAKYVLKQSHEGDQAGGAQPQRNATPLGAGPPRTPAEIRSLPGVNVLDVMEGGNMLLETAPETMEQIRPLLRGWIVEEEGVYEAPWSDQMRFDTE